MKKLRHRRHSQIAFVVLFLFVSLELSAGAEFTLQQVMSSPFSSNLVAATHAPRVAWILTTKGSRNLWIADAPEFAARQVTRFSGDDGQPLRRTDTGVVLVALLIWAVPPSSCCR